MAHSRPRTLENKGDAERARIVAEALIAELWVDRRVKAYSEGWHPIRQRMVKGIALETVQRHDERHGAWLLDQWLAVERRETRLFVADTLGLSRWARWIAVCLLNVFEITDWNLTHPHERPRGFAVLVQMRKQARKGKRPAHDGDDLVRMVRWFYRHRVQQPPESIHDLARDYAAGRATDDDGARSVVRKGIATVEAFLDLIDARSVRVKTLTHEIEGLEVPPAQRVKPYEK